MTVAGGVVGVRSRWVLDGGVSSGVLFLSFLMTFGEHSPLCWLLWRFWKDG